VEVTSKSGLKGKVLSRTTTDVTVLLDNGQEVCWDIEEDITMVKVTIKRAKDLANKDTFTKSDKSDPYVTCELKGKPQTRVKTPMVLNDLNPEWNFQANVLGYTLGDSLVFEVWDKDYVQDGYLGKCTLEFQGQGSEEFNGELGLLDSKGKPVNGVLEVQTILSAAPTAAPPTEAQEKSPFEPDTKVVNQPSWVCGGFC